MNTYKSTISKAIDIFRGMSPRGQYGIDVIEGRQAWSGADLKGAAREFGGSYARARRTAETALRQAGGMLVYLRPNGKLVAAVPCGTDDFGTQLLAIKGRTITAGQCR